MTFNPSTFQIAPDRHAGFGNHMFWGGGHTNDTLPTKKGWKAARPSLETQEFRPWTRRNPPISPLLLVGQAGVPGCATLLHNKGRRAGTVDVAIYDETPEVINRRLAASVGTDAMYHQLPNIPGVGLSVIRLIEEHRKQNAD
jgi:hypothetical protein